MLSLIVFIVNYDQCMLRLDILYLTTKVLFLFFFTNYKYMYTKYRPTKHFSITWVLYFYCLPQAIIYLLYSDVLIAWNHEFVQSTKEIQVASFYIYCLSFVAVFYRF